MHRIPRPTFGAIFLAAAILGLFVAISSGSADNSAMVLPTDGERLIVDTAAGERSFSIEIADDAGERSRGLMFRETMDDGHGMLFVFEEQRPVGFWMKNTPMPLDLVFISEDGTVKAVLKGEPYSEAVISPGAPVRFVLELKAGVAAQNRIDDGDKVRHRAIGAVGQQ
jgi:uncharacterized membrane protein (UPF0127 family)